MNDNEYSFEPILRKDDEIFNEFYNLSKKHLSEEIYDIIYEYYYYFLFLPLPHTIDFMNISDSDDFVNPNHYYNCANRNHSLN